MIRYTMTGGSANVTDSLLSPVIHDRRTLVRPNPVYFNHMTKGAIGSTAAADAIDGANQDTLSTTFSGSESPDFAASPFGAMWQSHSPAGNSVLYYSAVADIGGTPTRHTWRMGPNEVNTLTTGAAQTFTFDGANIWLINPSGSLNLNPSGIFGPGTIIEVRHTGAGNTITFDSGGIATAITTGKYSRFVYNGTIWALLVTA